MHEDFARTYRAHVIPELKRRIPIAASLIVRDVSDFGTEAAALTGWAYRVGGSRLPRAMWDGPDGLELWIGETLFEEYQRQEASQTLLTGHSPVERDLIERLEDAVMFYELALVYFAAITPRRMWPLGYFDDDRAEQPARANAA